MMKSIIFHTVRWSDPKAKSDVVLNRIPRRPRPARKLSKTGCNYSQAHFCWDWIWNYGITYVCFMKEIGELSSEIHFKTYSELCQVLRIRRNTIRTNVEHSNETKTIQRNRYRRNGNSNESVKIKIFNVNFSVKVEIFDYFLAFHFCFESNISEISSWFLVSSRNDIQPNRFSINSVASGCSKKFKQN